MSDLSVLLAGYLDGELGPEELGRVEEALERDPALRAELAEMRALARLMGWLGTDERSDAALTLFWGGVYNRLERRTGWFLLLGGLFGLVALLAALFFGSPTTPPGVKLAVAALGLGSALLLGSVWREQARAARHDRYSREIIR